MSRQQTGQGLGHINSHFLGQKTKKKALTDVPEGAPKSFNLKLNL